MSGEPPQPEGWDAGAERRRERRAERARRDRARRRLGWLAGGALAAGIAIAVVGPVGSSGPPRRAPPPARARVAPTPQGRSRRERRARARARGPTVSGKAARRTAVPILMYHVLSTPPAEARYPALWVSPAAFRSHVRALAAAGYEGVTLTEVFAAWRRGIKLPRKPVVLTFDDGYRSDATVAGPVLASRGWPGVLNLEIHNATPAGISRARLRRLVRAGWEIASHTMSHPDLTTLGPRRLREEVVRSRAWIRRRLGGPAAFFCYPAGRFNAAVIAAVRAAGYRGATTEIPGVASARDDPFRLPRVRVAAGEPARDLLAALR